MFTWAGRVNSVHNRLAELWAGRSSQLNVACMDINCKRKAENVADGVKYVKLTFGRRVNKTVFHNRLAELRQVGFTVFTTQRQTCGRKSKYSSVPSSRAVVGIGLTIVNNRAAYVWHWQEG